MSNGTAAAFLSLTSPGWTRALAILTFALSVYWAFTDRHVEAVIGIAAVQSFASTLRSTSALAAEREHALKMRGQIWARFRAPNIDREASFRFPQRKFASVRLIVRSLRDTSYPSSGSSNGGFYSWCGVELYDFYHDGIVVWRNVVDGVLDSSGRWALVADRKRQYLEPYTQVRVHHLSCIPYSVIRSLDPSGDEFYTDPQIHCSYEFRGTPFIEDRYAAIHADREERLYEDDRFELEMPSAQR
jgi:hypothetical protein